MLWFVSFSKILWQNARMDYRFEAFASTINVSKSLDNHRFLRVTSDYWQKTLHLKRKYVPITMLINTSSIETIRNIVSEIT